jgi:deazaflavin-dependent oxidoreductase (nitroreductase family)
MIRPSPTLRRILRVPVGLYDLGLGRLFGHRFLLLTHRGRRSGRRFRTMLEVLQWEPKRREAIVMSGFGPRSNWFLNIRAGGAEEIHLSAQRFRPQVRYLEADEAVEVLAGYERRSRILTTVVHRVLGRLAGFRYDASAQARRRLVEELPLVGFSDREPAEREPGVRRSSDR